MSLIKANTIKPVTSGADLSLQGDSGGSAVDCLNITSAGDVNFSGNTDAKIKLPSAGGIYESDGSTPVLTESGGVVSLGSGVALPDGSVLQIKSAVTSAYAEISGNYPNNDVIPVKTGGGEVITQAITASDSSNTFLIVANISGSPATNDFCSIALFKDDDTNAIAAIGHSAGGNDYQMSPLTLVCKNVAGSTDEITYKVRAGCTGFNFQVNGDGPARKLGGVAATTLTIYEIKGGI